MMMNQRRLSERAARPGVDAASAGAVCACRVAGTTAPTAKSPAMVYPVRMEFEDLYAPEEALCRGTLFKALDMPFHKGFRI